MHSPTDLSFGEITPLPVKGLLLDGAEIFSAREEPPLTVRGGWVVGLTGEVGHELSHPLS